MKPLIRFGRRIPIPSSIQVRHELRSFIAEDNVRELCAEAEGMSSSAAWDEICARRAGIVNSTRVERTALQNAASVASLLITPEAMVVELAKKEVGASGMPGGGDY